MASFEGNLQCFCKNTNPWWKDILASLAFYFSYKAHSRIYKDRIRNTFYKIVQLQDFWSRNLISIITEQFCNLIQYMDLATKLKIS